MPFRNPFNILRICAEVDQKKEKEKKKEGGKGTNKIRRQIRIVITLLDGGNFRVEVGKQEKNGGGKERERERNASLTKNKCKGLM